ncbi:MAG: RteC domain-containing protein [Pricia sp.]
MAVTNHGFESIEKEIHFFKNVKSEALSYLIYYTEVRSCEMQLPKWILQAKLAHIEGEASRINSFLNQNLDFRFYMENGNGEKDEIYFSRKYLKESPINISSHYFRNSSFNTSHDELWATIKGFGMYGNYLNGLKTKLETAPNEVSEPRDKDYPYRFTKSATAAMELIYALKLAGFINHGDFEIKAFVEFFSKTFGLVIKDPYGLFKQIAQRKSDRAKYLSILKNALLTELQKRDEYIQ